MVIKLGCDIRISFVLQFLPPSFILGEIKHDIHNTKCIERSTYYCLIYCYQLHECNITSSIERGATVTG